VPTQTFTDPTPFAIQVLPPPGPPPAPSLSWVIVQWIGTNTARVRLTWTASPGATGYRLAHVDAYGNIAWAYPITINGQTGVVFDLGNTTSLEFTDAGMQYPLHLAVFAVNAYGQAESNVVNVQA
jgi:hypothetical protein